MSYQGGKKHLGKKIYDVIDLLEDYLNSGEYLTYIEPFVGFCGVMMHANTSREGNECIGYDKNEDVIEMWKALQNGWNPPLSCSKKKYEELKYSDKHTAERGFIGVACSYSGIFFGGGFRNTLRYSDKNVNLLNMTSRSIKKTVKKVSSVKFQSIDYQQLKPKKSLIYCDPPYINNTYNTKYFNEFNHKIFWETMRKWAKNNIVIISEYTAPKDFKCIWSSNKSINHSNMQKEEVEKLFIYIDTYAKLDPKIKRQIKNV